MLPFKQSVKIKTKAEWQSGYIDIDKINQIIQIFKVINILYRHITHHNNIAIEEINEVPPDQMELLESLGGELEALVLFEKRKADAFIMYKTYELYSSWLLVEQALSNLNEINFKEHSYYISRKNIKQSVEIMYQNTREVLKYIQINEEIIKTINSDLNTYVYPFYENQEVTYSFFMDRNSLKSFFTFINDFYGEQFCSAYNENKLDLLTQNKAKQVKPKEFFLMGLFIGFVLLLVILMTLSFVFNLVEPDYQTNTPQSFVYIFPMFRGVGLFILYMWGLSWNIWGFISYGVNYRLILKMGSHYSTYIQVMKRAGFFTSLLLLMVIIYLVGEQYSMTRNYPTPLIQYTPFVVYIIFFSYIFFPSRQVFNPRGRKYFYTVLRNILFSPAIKMTFIIAFTTDQFVSFVQPLKDFAYTICYYSSNFTVPEIKNCLSTTTVQGVLIGYIIAIIPLMFRMVQCFNQARQTTGKFFGHIQMWNFLKYTTSLITATLSFLNKFTPSLLIPYICSSVISTCYAYYWDLKYDWGFLEKKSRYRFLRDTLSYKNPTVYYVAVVANFLLRCSWTLTISSFVVARLNSTILVFVTGLLEIFRRCMWNFFRIQKEHLVNCKDFRTSEAVESILSSLSVKGSIKGNTEESDHYVLLDNTNPNIVYRQSKNKVYDTHSSTIQILRNTTPQMVENALYFFKQTVSRQEPFIKSLKYQETRKKLFSLIGKRQVTLAKYKLKQS